MIKYYLKYKTKNTASHYCFLGYENNRLNVSKKIYAKSLKEARMILFRENRIDEIKEFEHKIDFDIV